MPRYRGSVSNTFADAMDGVVGSMTKTAMSVATEVSAGMKADLRLQVTQAGMGARLANTWRSKVYPDGGQVSLNPAAYVYSKAPDIVDAFSRGAVIVPVNGSKYLAIPTRNVPYKGRGKRMAPLDVETAFNQDLKFGHSASGKLFAFIEAVRSKNQSTWRRATKGRLKQGRQVKIVVMFILTPVARMPKIFDLDAVAEDWGSRAQSMIQNRQENT